LQSLKRHKPLIIISDIVMPEMDWYELCHQIKSEKTLKEIPVILLTSLSDPADIIRGLLCAADNFIVKPYDEKYLLSRIEYILANRELRKHERSQLGVELYFAGQRHSITSDRMQILDLLISTYEAAVEKNRELLKCQDDLKKLNEQLEGKVQQRTAALTQEIAEHKKTEEALRESGLKLRAVWEKANDGMRITDEEGTIVLVNDAYCAMVGKPRDEIVGKPMSVIFEEAKQVEKLRKHQDRFRSRSVPHHLERDVVLWNGRKISLELSNTFLEIPHHPALLLSVFRDITGRKRSEEALKKAEEKYRGIFENAVEGIFQSTHDWKFMDVNPALARMLGYGSSKELLNSVTNIKEQFFVDPKRGDELKHHADTDEMIHGDQFQIYRKDKSVIWVSLTLSAIRDQHGKILYYQGIAQDITEHKKLQEQVLRNQRLESIGILAGGIAHDLNNVLAPIMMSVQILKRQNTDQVSQRILSTLDASAKRGADIIRQVLTFARGAEGERGMLQPKHLIHEVENFVKETFPKTIQVHAHNPGDLKIINGDATQLYQVLLNLCVNARDAMPSGGALKLDAKNTVLGEH
ncbi:MAG: PAS domain S-box protein, partial [Deltaproteobacteria bacterium]|nr:PAS domain S-box protein [Deltaproteobacteria bacterium]